MFIRNSKLAPLKGKKRKRKITKESDWKDYYGSSETLKQDVQLHGKHNFKRTILKLCTCKWQLKYEELLVQIKNNILFRDDVYNGIINLRIGSVPKDLKHYYQKTSLVQNDDFVGANNNAAELFSKEFECFNI